MSILIRLFILAGTAAIAASGLMYFLCDRLLLSREERNRLNTIGSLLGFHGMTFCSLGVVMATIFLGWEIPKTETYQLLFISLPLVLINLGLGLRHLTFCERYHRDKLDKLGKIGESLITVGAIVFIVGVVVSTLVFVPGI